MFCTRVQGLLQGCMYSLHTLYDLCIPFKYVQ